MYSFEAHFPQGAKRHAVPDAPGAWILTSPRAAVVARIHVYLSPRQDGSSRGPYHSHLTAVRYIYSRYPMRGSNKSTRGLEGAMSRRYHAESAPALSLHV